MIIHWGFNIKWPQQKPGSSCHFTGQKMSAKDLQNNPARLADAQKKLQTCARALRNRMVLLVFPDVFVGDKCWVKTCPDRWWWNVWLGWRWFLPNIFEKPYYLGMVCSRILRQTYAQFPCVSMWLCGEMFGWSSQVPMLKSRKSLQMIFASPLLEL